MRLARAGQIGFKIAHDIPGARFKLDDKAPGRVAPEDLRDKDKTEREAIGVGADFIEGDGTLKPGAKLGEALRGECEHQGAAAIGGLTLERLKQMAAAEAVQCGVNGTGRVGIVTKRRSGEVLAECIARGGFLVEQAKEKVFEIGESAHNHTQRTMNRTPRTVIVK